MQPEELPPEFHKMPDILETHATMVARALLGAAARGGPRRGPRVPPAPPRHAAAIGAGHPDADHAGRRRRVVMLIVGASLARAFGIVGVASLIRYRAKIDDPKDAVVMLVHARRSVWRRASSCTDLRRSPRCSSSACSGSSNRSSRSSGRRSS